MLRGSPVRNFIASVLIERRTLEQALADLRAKYERGPDPELARMIGHAEAEIADRTQQRTGLTLIL